MAPKTQEDLDLLRDAAREVKARFAPRQTSKVRFGARAGFRVDDGLSTKPAPGPKGPPTDQLLADAARRRREQRERDRG